MKILFVRPPRYMWPFNSESSSFWQPLGFASMAAVLREDDFEVEIIDCLAQKIGWISLQKIMEVKKFDVLSVGDETASAKESIKLAQFVKTIKPEVPVIGGGYFFPYMPELSLNKWGIDYLVKGEGEETLLELVKFLDKNGDGAKNNILGLRKIDGIIFRKNKNNNTKQNNIVNSERAPLDMEKLPLPAYDLLPMEIYGQNSKNHKDFSAIEHGRGCNGGCNFCSINSLYSYKNKSNYRTKSAEKSFLETELLVNKYKRKTLNWVDGTFNLDSKWSKEYFGLLEDNNLSLTHTAWMRADCVIRDQKSGVLKKMVDNGLRQSIIGMERLNDCEHVKLGTHNKEYKTCIDAFKILKKYGSVYTIATLIYGLPQDGKKELKEIENFIYDDVVDFQFILPFTPYPGTKQWSKFADKFNENDFQSWNLHRPVMGTKKLSRDELDRWFKKCLLKYMLNKNFYKRTLFEKDLRKRKIQQSMAKKLIKGLAVGVRDSIAGKKDMEYGIKPKWYDQ